MLFPAPPDSSILPAEVEQRPAFRAFVEAVEEALPHLEIREDYAAATAWAQAVADLGFEVPDGLARLVLRYVPDARVRVVLREVGAVHLFPSTGSLEAIRSGAVFAVGDVRTAAPSFRRRPARRRCPIG